MPGSKPPFALFRQVSVSLIWSKWKWTLGGTSNCEMDHFLYCEHGTICGAHRPWLSQTRDVRTNFWSLTEKLRWNPSLWGCGKDEHRCVSGKIPKVMKTWITRHCCLCVVNFSCGERVLLGRKTDQLSHLTSKAQLVSRGCTKPILWAVSEGVLFPSQLG